MIASSRMTFRWAVLAAAFCGALLACPLVGQADERSAGVFALRNHNPFLQVFGLPTFETARLARSGQRDIRLTLDLANHADAEEWPNEKFRIDGESYYLTFSVRQRLAAWLELGVDVPLVAHSDGFMDHAIEFWHDALGVTNAKRGGPADELAFLYERDGELLFSMDSPASGLGDIQFTAAVPVATARDDKTAVSLRASIKIPTGDPDHMFGSGAVDFALGLYVADERTWRERNLDLSVFAGALVLGDGDILPALQRNSVPYGGAAAAWHVSDRFSIVAQLYGQGSCFRTDIEELGGNSLQLAVGADLRTRRGTRFRLAIVEDVAANATTDFALHLSTTFAGSKP